MKYKDLLNKIFNGYPRQIGLPERKDINNETELFNTINAFNKKKRVFISLYKYSFQNTRDFIIDKIWFDFDDNGYENINILHDWLIQKNIKHFMVFSGGGYHCYIITDKSKLKNSKIALTNAQNYMINETKINVDRQVIGDTARLVGVPGTYNIKRKRYVIFINEEDLRNGDEFIKSKAEKNSIGNFNIYGEKKFDMKEWDTGVPEFDIDFPIAKNLNTQIKENEILKGMLPCIANILIQLPDLEHSYNERYVVINQLIEDGYGEKDIENILKQHLSPKKFKHCIIEEKQVRYLMKRGILPPGCNILKSKGYCPYKNGELCKLIKEESK